MTLPMMNGFFTHSGGVQKLEPGLPNDLKYICWRGKGHRPYLFLIPFFLGSKFYKGNAVIDGPCDGFIAHKTDP